MSKVPSRQARLAHAAKHAELWNAGKKDEWVASWRTICPGEVRMFDPVGTEEKHGFAAATSDAFDMFQSILKINMITVQVNGNEMAWVCENHFGTEPNVQMAHSIETFAWDAAEVPAHQDLLPDARIGRSRGRPLCPSTGRAEIVNADGDVVEF